MSDRIVKIIPADPLYCCDEQTANQVVAHIKSNVSMCFPEADPSVEYELHENPEFVDCGSNLESITCPCCGEMIDFDWWGEAMDSAYEKDFRRLEITLPCCGKNSSLNSLIYCFACGFSRVQFDIWNPEAIPDSECLAAIEALLGVPVKMIEAHL